MRQYRDSDGKIRREIITWLNEKVKTYCIKTIKGFWDDIYQKYPNLERIIHFTRDKGGKITDQWYPTGMDHFKQYTMQLGLTDAENKIYEIINGYKAVGEPFGEFLVELLGAPREQRELAQELCKALKDDHLFDKVNKYREKDSELASDWTITLVNVFAQAWLKPYHYESGKLGISWPIAIDAYIRDFELFFEYIIRPCLQERIGYREDLSNFVQKSYCPLVQEWVKPKLRNHLIRMKYIIDLKNSEMKFFKEKRKNKITHSIKLDQFIQHVISMNLILWSVFTALYDLNQFQFPTSSKKLFPEQNELERLRGEKYYIEFKKSSLLKERAAEIQQFLVQQINQKQIELSVKPQAFTESTHFLQLLLESREPDWELIGLAIRKMGYLTSYLLFFDQFIRPISKAIDPSKLNDIDRLRTVKDYKGGRFTPLFQELDIDRRHAIAHFNYYSQDGGSTFFYRDRDGKEHPLLTYKGLALPRLLNFLDWAFDPIKEKAPLLIGLGEVLLGIRDPSYLQDDPNFYAMAAGTYAKSEYKKFQRIFWLVAGIQLIEQGNHPEGNKAIQQAMEPKADTTSEELDMLLCWFARYGKQVCKEKYRHALRTVMKRAATLFRTLKTSSAQSDLFWTLKCYEHEIWGEKKKADSCLAKISKITLK